MALAGLGRELLRLLAGLPCVASLKALQWLVHYKLGLCHLARLEWAEAGERFAASLQVYVEVGRRSMVPFMAMHAALCHLVAAAGGAAEGRGWCLELSTVWI